MNEDAKLKWLQEMQRQHQHGSDVEGIRKWIEWQRENKYEDFLAAEKQKKKNKKKDNKMSKLKKGDKVRLISTESTNAQYFQGDFSNLTIEKDYKHGGYDYVVRNGSDISVGVKASEIELIAEAPPKFKTGDLVDFISSSSTNAHYFSGGLEGLEIKAVSKGNANAGQRYVVWEADKSNSWAVDEHELMPSKVKSDKISIGDLVDIDMNHPDAPATFSRWFKSGTSGLKVLTVDSGHYNIETKDKDNSWWVDGEYLRISGQSNASKAPEPKFDTKYLEELVENLHTSRDIGKLTQAELKALLNRHYIFLSSDEDSVLINNNLISLSKERYNVLKSCIAGKVLTTQKYIKTKGPSGEHKVESVYVYDVQVSNEDIKKDLSLDVESIWRNPKPNVKNQKEITVDDLVMIDGEVPLLKVTKVTDKTCFVMKPNGDTRKAMKSSCYPLYEQMDTNIIKVGNVIKLKGKGHPAIVKRIGGGRIETTEGMEFHISEVESVFAKEKQTIEYQAFSCGSVTHEGKRYKSKEEFEKEYPSFKCIPKEEKHSLLNMDIAQHFNIKIDEIKPKEDTISHTLRTTLDHPLNVAKKRWALLVGPSGSGKTEAAIAYCKETGKEYVKLQGTAQLTVDDIIGYKSLTTGEYITSLLRDAVVNGKVFILDEIDACNPNTLLVLNGLKQEKFQFPDELVKIHKDFKFIGTANTLEYSEEYNARAPMDKATIARFKVIHYDMKPHELAIRYGFDYVKDIKNMDRLTPREIEGLVLDKQIEEEVNKNVA